MENDNSCPLCQPVPDLETVWDVVEAQVDRYWLIRAMITRRTILNLVLHAIQFGFIVYLMGAL